MNIILLNGKVNQTVFTLSSEQTRHVRKVLKAQIGDVLRIGLVNGPIGTARLIGFESTAATVELIQWCQEPSVYRPWHVVLALPRPPVFRRVLQSLASLSVKAITVVNAEKVEQSYWQSQVLQPTTIDHNLKLGMEQGVTTYRPPVECLRSFDQVVENIRLDWIGSGSCWVADPSASVPGFPLGQFAASDSTSSSIHHLFVGPEGGWSQSELALFSSFGMRSVSLGRGILRVEVAVAYLAGMLFQVSAANPSPCCAGDMALL